MPKAWYSKLVDLLATPFRCGYNSRKEQYVRFITSKSTLQPDDPLFLHLFTDVAFYNWPVQLLWPLSRRGAAFDLIGWNDLTPTLVLYAGCLGAVFWPGAAAAGVTGFFLVLGWRSLRQAPATGWPGWLAGGWAVGVHPVWRWLTGDFIS
jgi:hypothetical protein